jgi:biotin synthase
MVDSAVERIVDASLAGEGFSEEELLYLFKVKPGSEELALMQDAKNQISKRLANERGMRATIFAQIGVDAKPCPGNCFHCSFAVRFNTRPREKWTLTDDEVVNYAVDFTNRGANAITLMVTEAYDFSRLLELITKVREAVGLDMPIQMNMGDFNLARAEQLKNAGVTSIYHAVRMGEGLVNDIPLERRFETYAAANAVDMKIGAGVENVSPMFTDKAIAHMIYRVKTEVSPQSFGCVSKRLVKGTAGFNEPDFPDEVMNIYQVSAALLMSGSVKFMGGGCTYAEAGMNPRDWSMHTEVDGLIKQRGTSLERFADEFRSQGFIVEPGPSRFW